MRFVVMAGVAGVMLPGCVGRDPPPLAPVVIPIPTSVSGVGPNHPAPARAPGGQTWTAEGRRRDLESRASRATTQVNLLLADLGPDSARLPPDARIDLDSLRAAGREIEDLQRRARVEPAGLSEYELQRWESAVAQMEQLHARIAAALTTFRSGAR